MFLYAVSRSEVRSHRSSLSAVPQFPPCLRQGLLSNTAYSGLLGALLSFLGVRCFSTWLLRGSRDLNSEPQACVVSALFTELSPHPRISSLKGHLQTKETCPENSGCCLGPWQALTLVWAQGGEVCQTHKHDTYYPLATVCRP